MPIETSSATRQRLLETAEVLFYEEGFHTVGLDRVLAAVGISKQAFYRHFSSKEDLVLEVVRWHDRWWREQCRRLIRDMALCAGAGDPVAFSRELAMIFEGAFATRTLRRAEDVVPILRRMTATLFELRLPPTQ